MLNIFTLTWNGIDRLSKLKESLIPALKNIDYTWFIKDNNSKDNTFDVCSQWGDKVKAVKYKDNNQNFSAGNNYLFNLASPQENDLILLLNNDVIFKDTSSLNKMISIINNEADVGVGVAR